MNIIVALRSAAENVCTRAARAIDRMPRFVFRLAAVGACVLLSACGTAGPTALFDSHFANAKTCVDGKGAATMRADGASFTGTASNVIGVTQYIGSSVSISGHATYGGASADVSATPGWGNVPSINNFNTNGNGQVADIAQVATLAAGMIEQKAVNGGLSPNGACGINAVGVPANVIPYAPPAIIFVPGRGYPRDQRYRNDDHYDPNRGSYDRNRRYDPGYPGF